MIGADGTHSVVARRLNGPLRNSVCRLYGVAGHRRAPARSGSGRGDAGPGPRIRARSAGVPSHVLVRDRARPGRIPFPGRRARYLRASSHRGPSPTDPAGRDRPRCRAAERSLRPRPGAVLVEGSDRARRRRRAPDATHLGQGGCQGLEDAAILAASWTRPTTWRRRSRVTPVPSAEGAGFGARVGEDRPGPSTSAPPC